MEIPTQCVYVSLHQHFRTRPALTKIIALDFFVEGNWMSKCQSCRHDSLQYTNIEYSTIADRAINWGNMIYGNCCIFPEMFFQGSETWACGKWGVPEQRWIDLLRLGWSLSPWSTGSTGSKLWQPPSKTRVLLGYTPAEQCNTNNPDSSAALPLPASPTRGDVCV